MNKNYCKGLEEEFSGYACSTGRLKQTKRLEFYI